MKEKTPGSPKGGPRIRRTPEQARSEILAAAREVLGDMGPDRASLREVAARAGVSHALITHYFGTFDGLVEQTLELQLSELRAEFLQRLQSDGADLAGLVDFLFERLEDPTHGRLLAWAVLSGRLDRAEFFPRKRKGLVDVAAALTGKELKEEADGNQVEALIILVWCATLGYSVGSSVLWEALGRQRSEQRDAQYRQLLTSLVRHALGDERK